MSFNIVAKGQDMRLITQAVNLGIDSRLEGFVQSRFDLQSENIGRFKLYSLDCNIAIEELQILIRRLLEQGTEEAELLADSIVLVKYGYEVV